MRRRLWSMALALATGLLISGCSQRQQAAQPQPQPQTRVAGTEETAKPSMVTVTLTGTRLTVMPATIPMGDARLTITNTSTKPRTVMVTGPNKMSKKSPMIDAKKGATLDLMGLKPGKYTITSPAAGGQPELYATLTVAKTAKATKPAKAALLTMTVTNKRVTFSPASVPTGSILLTVTNAGSSAMNITTSGQKAAAQHTVLRPKESQHVQITITPAMTPTAVKKRSGATMPK